MSQNRKLSVPADNPQYFSLTDWPEGSSMARAGDDQTSRLTVEEIGDLEPSITNEVIQSLHNIEKLAGKQGSTKAKTKGGLGSSLRRLFRSGQRRGSSGVENEYHPAPLPGGHQVSGSLPTTPTKMLNNNSLFRHSTDSGKTINFPPNMSLLGTPMSPSQGEPRCYYNIENKSATLKVSKTPVNHSKPPPGPSRTPQKVRSLSVSQTMPRSLANVGEETWPGLEGPPVPILHRVCRGYQARDLPRIVILYSGSCNESRRWREYLAKALEETVSGQRTEEKVRGQRLEEFAETAVSGEEGRRCEEIVYHADVVLVILSPKLIAWLEKTKIIIGKILRPGRVVGCFEGMTPADITPTAANCLQTLPCWKTVDLDQSGDNSDFLIANNCKEILSKQEVLNTPIPENMSRFKLFPKKVSAGHNKLMIMMDTNIDQLDREHLECKICLEDYHYTIEDAKWIKDDIVQVELPSVMFQSTMIARLELRLNDTNYGSRQIKLENAAAILENAWSLCSDPVTSLSEAFDVRFVNIQDIDEFLSASLEKKLSISDLLKTKYTGCEREGEGCRCDNKDHNNLLHFSAKHGLSRLCSTLLSLGYQRYLTLPNILGLNPAEIAEKSGHLSLGQELRGAMPGPKHEYHQYQYPSLGLVREGEDGYLLPHCDTTQYFEHEYQVPGVPPDKHNSEHPDDFYQVPPAPIPLPARNSPASSGSTGSTPPNYRLRNPVGYLPMMPPLRKAMSEPRSDNSMFIPKSGSFSHFTSTRGGKSKYLADNQDPQHVVMSQRELIQTYEESKKRPESTPPDLGFHRAGSPTAPVKIESNNTNTISRQQSSPLQHYVHTDKDRDGMVYLPMYYDVPRRLSTDTNLSPDQTFLEQIKEAQAQTVTSVIKNNNKGAYENVTIRHSKC